MTQKMDAIVEVFDIRIDEHQEFLDFSIIVSKQMKNIGLNMERR